MREGFKSSPFGEIPSHWKVITVKEATAEHKQGYYTKEEYCTEGIKLARITDLGNPKVNFATMPNLNISNKDYEDFKISLGDFLFARSGAIGRYGIVEEEPEPTIFASYLIRFRFNQTCLINRYFGYFFESFYCKKQLASITQGNANVNINAENIKSLKIPLPPLPEQKNIAETLSIVDEKITVIDEQIGQTQELKKGLMQRLLTKGIGHTKFKPSPLGDIPESWKVVELSEISSITRLAGYEYTQYWKEDANGEIMSLRGYNIGPNKIILRDIVRISNELSMQLNRSRLYKGDIVFPCVGTIGNAVVIEDNDKYHINQNIAKITPHKELNSYFLAFYLMSDMCRKEINRFNASSSQPNVLVGSLRKFRVPFPNDYAEQEKIAETISVISEKLEVLQEKKERYQEMKKGLMQQLLTGKLRINHLTAQPELA